MTRAFCLCVASLIAATGFAQTRVPVVVELFTSEGCSSCPPADAILARLDSGARLDGGGRDGGPRLDGGAGGRTKGGPGGRSVPSSIEVIALEEHVDYWDNQGWKDRFSSPLFSARQQDYGIAFGASSVYTPQAVVNGSKQVVGADLPALARLIGEAANAPRTAITLRLDPDSQNPTLVSRARSSGKDRLSFQSLMIQVDKLPVGSHNAEVFLAIAEDNIDTDVAAGENGGHRLHHTGVVRSMSRLAELDPTKPGSYAAEAKLNLRDEWKRANLKVVVFVQDRQTRKILGAASLKL